jgi:hypothetical protein
MRRYLIVVPLCAAALAGCTSSASPGPNTPAVAPGSGSPTPVTAKLGATLELKDERGQHIAVTAVSVIDPAPASDTYSTASAGSRLVAVQFRITNKAPAVYHDDPDADVSAFDGQGMQHQVSLTGTGAGPGLNSALRLPPGGSTSGYETFELPAGSKFTMVQYQLADGMSAGSVGQWTIG